MSALDKILGTLPPDAAGRTKTAGDQAVDQILSEFDFDLSEESETKEASDESVETEEVKEAEETAPAEASLPQLSQEAILAAVKSANAILSQSDEDGPDKTAAPAETSSQEEVRAAAIEDLKIANAEQVAAEMKIAHVEWRAVYQTAAFTDELVKIGEHLGAGNAYEEMEQAHMFGGEAPALSEKAASLTLQAMDVEEAIKLRSGSDSETEAGGASQ